MLNRESPAGTWSTSGGWQREVLEPLELRGVMGDCLGGHTRPGEQGSFFRLAANPWPEAGVSSHRKTSDARSWQFVDRDRRSGDGGLPTKGAHPVDRRARGFTASCSKE